MLLPCVATVSSQPAVDDMERCSPPCQELQGGLETFSTYDGAWQEAPNGTGSWTKCGPGGNSLKLVQKLWKITGHPMQ